MPVQAIPGLSLNEVVSSPAEISLGRTYGFPLQRKSLFWTTLQSRELSGWHSHYSGQSKYKIFPWGEGLAPNGNGISQGMELHPSRVLPRGHTIAGFVLLYFCRLFGHFGVPGKFTRAGDWAVGFYFHFFFQSLRFLLYLFSPSFSFFSIFFLTRGNKSTTSKTGRGCLPFAPFSH